MAPLACPVSILASGKRNGCCRYAEFIFIYPEGWKRPGQGSDMKLAQILATLDAFGLHARGSTTLTGAPGPADRLDKLLQHLGLSGFKLASGGLAG